MRMSFSKVKLFFVFVILFLLGGFSAFAQENIISSVTISKAENNVNSYILNIDSSKTSAYNMRIENDMSVYFDIKNAVLASDAATYYDDAANINSIILKQLTNDKVRIYLQGQNVKNTEITFVNSLVENTKQAKKITINRPVNEYAPTNNEIDLEDMENIQDWSDNSFNLNQLMRVLKDGVGGMVLAFLMIFAIIIYAIKMLSKKISQEREPLIGLKQHKSVDKEINKKVFENYVNNQANNLESITKRSLALQNARDELTKAHQKYQQYLQGKYNNKTPLKKQYTTDSVTKGIALNQYQKNERNPYPNQSAIKLNGQIPVDNNGINPSGNFQIPPRNNLQNNIKSNIRPYRPPHAAPTNTAPYIQRNTQSMPNISENISERQKPYVKSDNMKFLESVTKIYEQSGRSDLADELKNTIMKTKRF